ncbi:hypothetical protein TNIN_59391 [Trichonephila inaurata madagascariensis]|uniref:Uncharacterized protein n=1 Tax=Trichonephila inaurata madagascariensis TaxID=2747483 RepID=A0A8X6Y9C1_9ARAC|nr:hypothetical protein TNIN_59391 [Trichonephila inaurata madagascariensis]
MLDVYKGITGFKKSRREYDDSDFDNGSCITKRTSKKQVADKKKLLKALEKTMRDKIETELSTRAGGSSLIDKNKPASKSKNVRKGKKK